MKVFGLTVLAAVLLQPTPAEAQQAGQGQGAAGLTLVYEREVYTYRAQNRRDPFRPLTDADEMGPRFEALSLRGIIYATGRGQSVALLSDAEERVYRVRVGDTVGNSRIIEIGPTRS